MMTEEESRALEALLGGVEADKSIDEKEFAALLKIQGCKFILQGLASSGDVTMWRAVIVNEDWVGMTRVYKTRTRQEAVKRAMEDWLVNKLQTDGFVGFWDA